MEALRICVETNAYSDLMRGDEAVISLLEYAEVIVVPAPVLGQLYAGFLRGTRRERNLETLSIFLDKPGIRIAPVDHEAARQYGRILSTLLKQGTPIPTNDIWIAAIAIVWNATLITRDEHFTKVPYLAIAGSPPVTGDRRS